MEHRPLKRRRSTSSIHDYDKPSSKRIRTVLNRLQQTAEEVRCALNTATWLSVQERLLAALAIDHVAGMSRMVETCYEFGDVELVEDADTDVEEHFEGDSGEDSWDTGDAIEEVANNDLGTPFGDDVRGSLEEKDVNEGCDREDGSDEDGYEDGDSDRGEENEDSLSSWIRRGVSLSAGASCTACTESGGS